MHLQMLRHLVKYLKGTKEWEWPYFYQDVPKRLSGFSDSDWAANVETRRSVSCGVIFHGNHSLEAWVSGQQLVAL